VKPRDSKFTAILVHLAAPLSSRDPREQDYLRWLFGEFFRGIDAQHHRRWLRQVARWFTRGGNWTFYPVESRDGRYHRMHMAMEQRIYRHQEAFASVKAFRVWLKTGACFGHYEASAGRLVFVPSSCSYEDCSDDEMREFHQDALEFLRTPYALGRLWPGDSRCLSDRQAALELLINPPREDQHDTDD
jgi:hypothetical protein